MKISCNFFLLALLHNCGADPAFMFFPDDAYYRGHVYGTTSTGQFAQFLKGYLRDHLVLAFYIQNLELIEYKEKLGLVYHTRREWAWTRNWDLTPSLYSSSYSVIDHFCYYYVLGEPHKTFDNVNNPMKALEILYEQSFASSFVISKDDANNDNHHNQVNVYCVIGRIHLIHFTNGGDNDKDIFTVHDRGEIYTPNYHRFLAQIQIA